MKLIKLRNLKLDELKIDRKYLVKYMKFIPEKIFIFKGLENGILIFQDEKTGKNKKIFKHIYIKDDIKCGWEDNKLMYNLMTVIAEFHMEHIRKKQSYKKIVSSIKSGGFTRKLKLEKNKLCFLDSIDKQQLMNDTIIFFNMSKDLSNNSIKYVSFDWCFYRAMANMPTEINSIISFPIPFATTSCLDLTYNWMENNDEKKEWDCDYKSCIYKIIVSGKTNFSILEDIYHEGYLDTLTRDEKAIYEGEIELPPGYLTIIDKKLVYLENEEIVFVTCKFSSYSIEETKNLISNMPICTN